MTRPCTVYFDTYFYVDLAGMEENEAWVVGDAMDELAIRPVLSPVVMEELLKNDGQHERDLCLAEHMLFLDQRSLCLEPYLSWGMVAVEGDERRALAEHYRENDQIRTLAESFAMTARSEHTPKQKAKSQAHLNRMIAKAGFKSALDFGQAQLEVVFEVLTPILKMAGVNLDDLEVPDLKKAEPEELKAFSEDLENHIPAAELNRIKTENMVADEVLIADSRPRKVVLGKANPKEVETLGNEYRDSKRITEFILHADEIDLLQIDKSQFERMEKLGEKHPLVKASLDGRCFWSRGPMDAIEKIRQHLAVAAGL